MIVRKCPYCTTDTGAKVFWFTGDNMKDHIDLSHPEKVYRTMKDLYASWKQIGMYEEKKV